MELDFTHPLTKEMVKYAAPKIQDNLTRVMESWYDEETRINDMRRTHLPLYRTVFRSNYEKDGITITNELPYGGDTQQFRYMYFGNTGRPICAHGFTRHILKGYSAKDRHKTVSRGGKKTEFGDLGVVRPRVLKFWSKRDNMFIYRQCVKPISTGIIISFQQDVKSAIYQALDSANWEASYEADIDGELGTSEDISAVQQTGESEDYIGDILDYGTIHIDKEEEEVENQLMTMASRVGQDVERRLVRQGERASGIKTFFSESVIKPVTGFLKGLWR